MRALRTSIVLVCGLWASPALGQPAPAGTGAAAEGPASTGGPAPAGDGAREPARSADAPPAGGGPSPWPSETTPPPEEGSTPPDPGRAFMVLEPEPRRPPPEEPPRRPCPPPDARPYEDLEAAFVELHAMGGWASLDRFELGTAEQEPDPLVGRALLLDGEGALLGGGLRFGYQTDEGVRFGAGLGGYLIEGLDLLGGDLGGGVRASVDEVVGFRAELALGKAFDAGAIWPYVDAVVSVNLVGADVGLSTREHGFVGTTAYFVPSATVAPRLGAFIPLSDEAFVDVAGQYGLFGVERGAILVGVGLWDD